MSNRLLILNNDFIRRNAPLANGLGRFIPQLQRVTIKFCKERGTSKGVRHFIEHDVVRFAQDNPHVVVYLKPRRNRSPVLVSEFLNGERHWQSLHNYTREEVQAWLDLLRTHSGKLFGFQGKYEYTDSPSVQGMWNSFTNVEPKIALAKFPDASLSVPPGTPPSTSERLVQMLREQQELEARGEQAVSEADRIQLDSQTQK